ncbi:MAG: arginine--tRNA ligase [Planctomycetes bacterium]|nr:arginine--tRNA ligase [Planctomycetota bacterium]HJM56426.1 arginine--tRNA ligase [Planctomycetota bacterium]
MQQFQDAVRDALIAETGLAQEAVRLETPRDPSMGDLAFPCFVLAKELKAAPPKIASDLESKLNDRLQGITAKATGPFLNFTIDPSLLASTTLGQIQEQGDAYGGSDEGHGKTIVLDLSSPNIAKPMSVGHLRSTVIGAAIQRVHNALGYTTVGINHIGDWGSQFGKLVAAVDRWGDTVDLEADPIKALLALYVRYHEEEEGDPELKQAGRDAFKELESGEDGKVRATWRNLTELSLAEFDKIYARLGVEFDEVRGEAYYESHLDATVERIVAAGITEESEGALIVRLSEFGEEVPPCLLRKTDGTTLYATRDLAAAFHRWELYSFERSLYVVGGDQRLHFRQLKHVLERMGVDWEPRMEHIDFGMMRLPEGKMSTRKGRVIFLEEVLDQAAAEADKVIAEKNPNLEARAEIAEMVGVGAVVFNDLKRERVKDVEFVWEEVLSFEGDTGPYVQYTHARLASILRKGAAEQAELDSEPVADWSALTGASPILGKLGRFNAVLSRAARNAEPSEITTYALSLCRDTNTWIAAERVLGQAPAATAARLALVDGVRQVLANALGILGVGAPERM